MYRIYTDTWMSEPFATWEQAIAELLRQNDYHLLGAWYPDGMPVNNPQGYILGRCGGAYRGAYIAKDGDWHPDYFVCKHEPFEAVKRA